MSFFNSILLAAAGTEGVITGQVMLGVTIAAFAILFILLAKFAWPKILATLDERERIIKDSLNKAQSIESNFVESEKKAAVKIEQASQEARAILMEAKNTAEEIKRDLEAKAKKEVESIRQRAQQEVEKIHESATKTLKEEAAGLAISLAEQILSKNFDKQENKQFIDKILKEN